MRAARRTACHASRRPAASAARAALLACAALVALAGCVSATGGVDPDTRVFAARRGTAGDISARLLQGAALTNDPTRSMLDVLAAYWPTTMRGDPRAQQLGGEDGLGVYINNNYMGGWDVLRTVRAGEVARVQRLTTSEEYMRYGRASINGAVLLTLKGMR